MCNLLELNTSSVVIKDGIYEPRWSIVIIPEDPAGNSLYLVVCVAKIVIKLNRLIKFNSCNTDYSCNHSQPLLLQEEDIECF